MEIDRNATCEITADDYVNLSIFDLLSRAKSGDALAQQTLARIARPVNKMNKYDENQPRDERGRFSSTAGITPEGNTERTELRGDVAEHIRLYLQMNRSDLMQRGLIPYGFSGQNSQAAKVMVMRDIAERMNTVPTEDIIAATADLGRARNESNDPFDYADELELQQALEDPNKGFLFDGESLTITGADPLVEDSMRYDSPEEKETCLREYLAACLVSNWAGTSNDESPPSLALQEVAEMTFGIKNAAGWEHPSEGEVLDLINQHGDVMDAFLQAQYDATQEFLSTTNTNEITLYRGTQNELVNNVESFPMGADLDLNMRPLSSWSTDRIVASGFGDRTITATFPAERIFSLPITGLGCLNEEEVVVLGGTIRGNIDR